MSSIHGTLVAALLASLTAAQGIKLNEPLAQPIAGVVDGFAITPDGARVVYAATQDDVDVFELFSAPADGSAPSVKLSPPLVSGNELDRSNLRVSNAHVVFEIETQSGPVELWSAPVDGSAPAVQLFPNAARFALDPLGARVVFESDIAIPGRLELLAVAVDASATPVSISGPMVPGGSVRGFDLEPCVFSPDGARVVYLADQAVAGRIELWSGPSDASAQPVRLNGPLVAGGQVQSSWYAAPAMRISPDGTRVVYRADQEVDERFEIFSVPIDGSAAALKLNATPVAGGDVFGDAAVPDFLISSSGRVLYRADQDLDGAPALYSAPLDASAPAVALTPAVLGRSLGRYAPSPDGAAVVYVADALAFQRFELFRVPLAGGAAPVRLSGGLVAGGDVASQFGREFAFSSDSRWVVYLADQEVNDLFELYRVPLAGRAPVRRSDKSPPPFQPVKLSSPLEPGEQVLVFELGVGGRVVFQTETHLYSAPLDVPGPAVRLDGVDQPFRAVFGFELAAAAPRVAYVSDEDEGVPQVFGVPLDGSTPAVKLNGPLPLGPVTGDVDKCEFSPDSQWVVYRADGDTEGVPELYSVRTNGRVQVRKLNSPIAFGDVSEQFAFHPSSSKVLFSVAGLFVRGLFVAPIDGGAAPLELTPPNSSVGQFAFSPDGGHVFFAGFSAGQPPGLFRVPTDGSASPLLLIPPYGAFVERFELVPDGTRVVYLAAPSAPLPRELYSVPSDGSGASIKLSAPLGGAQITDVRVAPNGLRVVYRVFQSGFYDLYSAPTDGSLPAVLLSPPLASGTLDEFTLSPDSARVVFRDPNIFAPRLLSVPIDGSAAAVTLTPALGTGSSLSPASVSPDSSLALFTAGSPPRLGRVPIDGSAPATALSSPGGTAFSFEITPDGTTVVYLGSEPGLDTGILRVPIDGSAPIVRLSEALAPTTFVQLALTSDASQALYWIEPSSGPQELRSVPLDGSRPSRRVNRPTAPGGSLVNDIDGPSFRFAPDSSRLVYRARLNGANVKELFLSLLERDALPGEHP